ncbi:hypothetical protein GCM10022224_085810 [Nonomuraea antimicrobica]|uniref:Uncharacterized protein n=1 Tax=Nonomuraea antimicrobica TaxID=561173 RepID=A0ABP7DNZ8_9ACTN
MKRWAGVPVTCTGTTVAEPGPAACAGIAGDTPNMAAAKVRAAMIRMSSTIGPRESGVHPVLITSEAIANARLVS